MGQHFNALRKMLTILKSRPGCSLEDFADTIPKDYENVDVDLGYIVLRSISRLVHWGLAEAFLDGTPISAIEMARIDRWNWPKGIVFYVSQNAIEIEQYLDVSLDRSPAAILGESDRVDSLDVFVLMPFNDQLRPIYTDHIRTVTNALSLRCVRADDFFSTGSVMADIWSALNCAAVIIADCTGRNPNVFYEIGLAHARGREAILITQSVDDIPFDLRHLRVITYEFTPRGMKRFEDALSATLIAVGPSAWPSHIAASREREQARARELAEARRTELAAETPCPRCGKPLRTGRARQCRHCGADWHSQNPDA